MWMRGRGEGVGWAVSDGWLWLLKPIVSAERSRDAGEHSGLASKALTYR